MERRNILNMWDFKYKLPEIPIRSKRIVASTIFILNVPITKICGAIFNIGKTTMLTVTKKSCGSTEWCI